MLGLENTHPIFSSIGLVWGGKLKERGWLEAAADMQKLFENFGDWNLDGQYSLLWGWLLHLGYKGYGFDGSPSRSSQFFGTII